MNSLAPHPADAAVPEVDALFAEAVLETAGRLRLAFRLQGSMPGLRVRGHAPAVHTDGLWRHTCFEAFLRADDGPAYVELNFAPTGAWAAYRFEGYREGMGPLALPAAPEVTRRYADSGLALDVALPLAALLPAPFTALRVALAAVIEDHSGTITHWALRHPGGRPDFHHPEGFVLALPGVPQPR